MSPQELEQLFSQRFQNEQALASQQPPQPQQQPQQQQPNLEALFEQRFQNEMAQARASQQAAEQPDRDFFTQSLPRQAALTLRYGGLPLAGAAAGAIIGKSPVSAAGGALIGYGAELFDEHVLNNAFQKSLDKYLGKAETESEKLGEKGARGMMSAMTMGGAAQGIANALPSSVFASVPAQVAKGLATEFGKFLGLGGISGGAASVAEEATRQSGGGEMAQMGAGMAAGVLTPMALANRFVEYLKKVPGQMMAAIRASGLDEKGIQSLAEDAIHAIMGKQGAKDNTAVLRAMDDATYGQKGVRSIPGEEVPGQPGVFKEDTPGARIRGEQDPMFPRLDPEGKIEMTVADAIASENIKRPTEQIGGAWIALQKGLRGAKGGAENVIPSAEKGGDYAIRQWLGAAKRFLDSKGLEPALAMRESRGPIRVREYKPLYDFIEAGFKTEAGGTDLGRRVLSGIRRQLMGYRNRDGSIDVRKLYATRKGINKIIRKYVKEGTPGDEKQVAKLAGEVKEQIDAVLDPGGSYGFKAYHKARERALARGEYARDVKAMKQELEATIPGTSADELAKADFPTLPTLLHRPTMAINFALKYIRQDIKDPVGRRVAELLTDPEKFAQVMRRAPNAPVRMKADQILSRAAVLATMMIEDAKNPEED